MGSSLERIGDAAYRGAANRLATTFLGSISVADLPPQLIRMPKTTALVVGRSALGLAKAGGSTLLRVPGLRAEASDLSRPEDWLEFRERSITLNREYIMSGEAGIDFGTHLFKPWSAAAWAVDSVKHPREVLKPPVALAEDYFITMDQRGVNDSYVREEITERVIEKLPKDVLDIDDLETMKVVDLHSMTRLR